MLPQARVQVSPTTLAPKFLMARYSSSTTPVRMVLSSGMPEPWWGRKWHQLSLGCGGSKFG